MTKEIHWRIPFENADEEKMCINIYAEGTPASIKTLAGGAIWDGGIMETSEETSDSPFDTLRFQTGTIHVANEDGDLSVYDIMPTKPTDRPVQLVRESDGKVMWQGFLSCEGYTQEYISRTQIVDFNIKSVLKALEDQQIPDNFREVHGELALSVGEMIQTAVNEYLQENECPFGITEWKYPDEHRYFQDCLVEMGLFYEEKEHIYEDGSVMKKMVGKTYGEIIEDVCLYVGVAVREYGSMVYMQPISSNGAIGGVTPTMMNMSELEYYGTDHTIKTDYPYKSLTIDINQKEGDSGEISLPSEDDIVFGVNGITTHEELFSYMALSWCDLEDDNIWINPDVLELQTTTTEDPTKTIGTVNDINPTIVANHFSNGKNFVYNGKYYATAKLCRFCIHNYYNGNYSTEYGVAIAQPYFIYCGYKCNHDVLVRFSQKEHCTYDNVQFKNLVSNKWSAINIQGNFIPLWSNSTGIFPGYFASKWSLRCFFYIEDQFGVREYLVGISDQNPQWATERNPFYLRMDTNEVYGNYDKDTMLFNSVDGFVIKFNNPFESRHIKCTMEIPVSAITMTETSTFAFEGSQYTLIINNLKISGIKDPFNFGASSKLGKKMYHELGGVEDDKTVDLNICTCYREGNNNHLSKLYKRYTDEETGDTAIVQAYDIEYTKSDGTTEYEKPEKVMFNRMVEQWSKPRRQIELDVHSLDTPLPITRFTGYDGKKYLPLCEKRDWGTNKSMITMFEVTEGDE